MLDDELSGWRMPDAGRLWESLATSIDCYITVIDRECRVRAINHVADGFEAGQVIGRCVFDFIHPDDVERVRAEYHALFDSGRSIALDMLVVDESGGEVPYSVRGAPVWEEGSVVAAVITSHDLRALLASEASLRAERTALRALLQTLERERRLISYEIHDGLAQSLASAGMHLDACMHALDGSPAGTPERLRDLAEARRGIGAAIEEARRLINGLRPPMLDELGIVAALESLVIDATSEGMAVDFRVDDVLPAIESDVATAIFRIVQESLSNARKHARCDLVRVSIVAAGDDVSVEVADDGVGFDPRQASGGGFGLEGIRQRARLFGREARIESVPGGGTRIAVLLPARGSGLASGPGGLRAGCPPPSTANGRRTSNSVAR